MREHMTDTRLRNLHRLLAAGLLGLLALSGCSRPGSKGPTYEYAAVTRGNIQEHVTASGALSALVSVDVGSQVSGKITHLYVDFNSPVHKDSWWPKSTRRCTRRRCNRRRVISPAPGRT